MIQLLEQYSLQNIITMIILLALAFKGCVSFLTWISESAKKMVHSAEVPNKLKENIEQHEQQIQDLRKSISDLTDMVHTLIDSDRDDIKAFITREYHYFVHQKGWIDQYSLNCIEKRYDHYKDQGGNSFVKDLIKELYALPRQQPQNKE